MSIKKLFFRFRESPAEAKLISTAIRIDTRSFQKRPDINRLKSSTHESQETLRLLRDLNSALTKANGNIDYLEAETKRFEMLFKSAQEMPAINLDSTAENILLKIIASCDSVSLNGLKILGGEALRIPIKEKKLEFKLPSITEKFIQLKEFIQSRPRIEIARIRTQEVQLEIENARRQIAVVQENILELINKQEVKTHNLKSSGISLSELDIVLKKIA